MAGLLRVPCKPQNNNDPLLKASINTVAAAGTTTNIAQFTVPTGRGEIKAIQVFVGSDTMADVSGGQITFKANGTSVLGVSSPESLIPYTTFYGNTNIPMLINIPEAATLDGQIINASGNAWTVVIDLYFFNPFEQ